jgi:cytochrome o ubiquinol oxidase operon protein cyoD
MKHYIEPLPRPSEKSAQSYIAGFLLSVTLTAAAFLLVWAYQASDGQIYSRGWLLGFISLLACVQLVVQARYFLHVSSDRGKRLNLLATLFTLMVVVTIVFGSLWVMQNLNYNMMPENTTEHIQHEEGISH